MSTRISMYPPGGSAGRRSELPERRREQPPVAPPPADSAPAIAAMQARGYAAIGLHRPKNALNMGEVMRAAGCYDVRLVAVAGHRFARAPTDTQEAWKHIPTIEVPELLDAMPVGAVPVAVEFIPSATPLPQFVHPERAFYILGPEDGSLPASIVQQCRHVVFVPTRFCMNLAATVNVLLYDRLAKQPRRPGVRHSSSSEAPAATA